MTQEQLRAEFEKETGIPWLSASDKWLVDWLESRLISLQSSHDEELREAIEFSYRRGNMDGHIDHSEAIDETVAAFKARKEQKA